MYKIAEIDAQLELPDQHRQLRMFKQRYCYSSSHISLIHACNQSLINQIGYLYRIGSEKDIFTAFFELLGVSPSNFNDPSSVVQMPQRSYQATLTSTRRHRILSALSYDIYDMNKVSRRLIILFAEWNRSLLELCKQFFGKDLAKLRDPNPGRWEGKDEKRHRKDSGSGSGSDSDSDEDEKSSNSKKPATLTARTESQRIISSAAAAAGGTPGLHPVTSPPIGPPTLRRGDSAQSAALSSTPGGGSTLVAPAPKRMAVLQSSPQSSHATVSITSVPQTASTNATTTTNATSTSTNNNQGQPPASTVLVSVDNGHFRVRTPSTGGSNGTSGTTTSGSHDTPSVSAVIAVPSSGGDQKTDGTSPNLSPAATAATTTSTSTTIATTPATGPSPSSASSSVASSPSSARRSISDSGQATPSPSPSPPPGSSDGTPHASTTATAMATPASTFLTVPVMPMGMTRSTSGSTIGHSTNIIDPHSSPTAPFHVPHVNTGGSDSAPSTLQRTTPLPSPHTPERPADAKKKTGEKEQGLLGTFLAALGANDHKANAHAKYDPTVSVESIVDRNVHMPAASFEFLKQASRAHVILPTLIGGNVIPVYEDEPSSMIAYTLCSVEHLAFINDMRVEDVSHLRPGVQLELMEPGPLSKQSLRHALNIAKLKLNAFQPIPSPHVPSYGVHPSAVGTSPSSTTSSSGAFSMAPVQLRPAQSLPNVNTMPPLSVVIAPSSAPSTIAAGPIATASTTSGTSAAAVTSPNVGSTIALASPLLQPMDSPPFTSITPSIAIPGASPASASTGGGGNNLSVAMSPMVDPSSSTSGMVPPFALDHRTISDGSNSSETAVLGPASPAVSEVSSSSLSSNTSGGATIVVIAGQSTGTTGVPSVSTASVISPTPSSTTNSSGVSARGVFIGPIASGATVAGSLPGTSQSPGPAPPSQPSPSIPLNNNGNAQILHVVDEDEPDEHVQRAMLSEITTSFKFKFEDQVPNVNDRTVCATLHPIH
jgi:hypothetical protein